MKNKIGALLFLCLMLSTSLVLAGTTKITVRMDDEYNALIRVKDGEAVIATPQIQNYPIGLAELTYSTGREKADYFILVHKSGSVKDSYTLEDIETGSELKVDFRSGVPPIVTDLEEESESAAEDPTEDEVENETGEEINLTSNENSTEANESNFNLSQSLSTGRAVFYSSDSGLTAFSWSLLGAIVLIVAFFAFGHLKNNGIDDVDKYKKELEHIKKQIRTKIKEIKILKAKGLKIKKMIELEEGFLDEKKGLSNIEKELSLESKTKKKKK